MIRPFTRAQALQNQAFLRALRRTGNVRAAAEALGVHRATYIKRRNRHPAFAAEWDAALALASATLQNPPRNGEGDHAKHGGGGSRRTSPSLETPEPHLVRLKSGRLQLRAKPPGRLTRAAEQAFLSALSATANIRLSAKAAGFTHGAFYHRARTHAGFAREMRLALQRGYDRLEDALSASLAPNAYADDAWRRNDPPPIPPMTADQALQLLHLHLKQARLLTEPPHLRQRRGESNAAHSYRMAEMYREVQRREREAFDLAEADRHARGAPSGAVPQLPALDQVTGWSAAKPEPKVWDADVAMFGGKRFK